MQGAKRQAVQKQISKIRIEARLSQGVDAPAFTFFWIPFFALSFPYASRNIRGRMGVKLNEACLRGWKQEQQLPKSCLLGFRFPFNRFLRAVNWGDGTGGEGEWHHFATALLGMTSFLSPIFPYLIPSKGEMQRIRDKGCPRGQQLGGVPWLSLNWLRFSL